MARSGAEGARQGFRFEDYVIVASFGEVLAGAAVVQFEGVVPSGTEGQIMRPGQPIENIQCKSGGDTQWTVNRLASEGVLDALAAAAGRNERFTFVTDRPVVLADLASDQNTQSESSDEDWWKAVSERSDGREVKRVADRLGCQPPDVRPILACASFRFMDRATARLLCELKLGAHLRAEIRRDAIRTLAFGLSEEGGLLGARITETTIDRFLCEEVGPQWRSQSLAEGLGRLQVLADEFITRHDHVGDPRPQAKHLCDLLDNGAAVVAVEGAGGMGKSAVIADAVALMRDGTSTIAVVDARSLPEDLAGLDGVWRALGIGDGLLETLVLHDRPVLVIDQLDSVSVALGGSSGRWTTVRHLYDRAVAAGIQVVIGCRPASGLDELTTGEADVRIVRLNEWTEDEMAQLTGQDRPLPAGVPRIPVFATFWRELSPVESDDGAMPGALLDAYRSHVRTTSEVSANDLATIESIMGEHLETRGTPACPGARLDGQSDAVDRLVAAGYLDRIPGGIVHRHEIVAEHAWALSFVRRGRSVDSLFRSPTFTSHRCLRHLFDYLAHGGASQHPELVRALHEATAPTVRPAIVAGAIGWMATADTSAIAAVWPVLRHQLTSPEPWRRETAARVLRERCRFLDEAWTSGTLTELAATEEGLNSVVWIAAGACSEHAATIASLANELLDADLDRSNHAANRWLWLTVENPIPPLVTVWRGALARTSDPDALLPEGYRLSQMVERSPSATAKVLAAWLSRHTALAKEGGHDGPFVGYVSAYGRRGPLDADHRVIQAIVAVDPEAFARELADPILAGCRALPEHSLDMPLFLANVTHGSGPGQPRSIEGLLVSNLERALALAPTSAAQFLAAHGDDRDDAAIAFCACAHRSRDDVGKIVDWLRALAVEDVTVGGWARDAVLGMLRSAETMSPGTINDLEATLRLWSIEPPLLVADEARLAEPIGPMQITSHEGSGSEVDQATVDKWSDDDWREALRAGSEGLMPLMRGPIRSAPARFLALVQDPTLDIEARLVATVLHEVARSDAFDDVEIDIDGLTILLGERLDGADTALAFLRLVRQAMRRKVEPAGRIVAERFTADRHPWVEQTNAHDPRWVEAERESRLDTVATVILGQWVGDHPEDVALLDDLVSRATSDGDIAMAAALVDALRWLAFADRDGADQRTLSLLQSFPSLHDSYALRDYQLDAWRNRRSCLLDHWSEVATTPPGSVRAGYAWTINRFVTRQAIDPSIVTALPHLSQQGVAEATCELLAAHNPTWAASVLDALLRSEHAEVQAEARRWEYQVTTANAADVVSLDRRPIPAALRRLIEPTVQGLSKLMDAHDLLECLAGGTPDQAVVACRLVTELLPRALGTDDLAYGWDVERCGDIAVLAYETLSASAEDPAPALDLMDHLVIDRPNALFARLSALR